MADQSEHVPHHLELTADAAKVLAHPLRSRLLGALRRGGPASATALAAELRTNTGATSYHLRRLESVQLVEDSGDGRGKERIWRASSESHGWQNTAFGDDDDARTALDWLVRDYHRQFDGAYTHWLDVEETWPKEWRDVAGMSDFWVEVTPAQLVEMESEIEALLNRYARRGAGDPEARRIALWRFVFPLEPDDVPAHPGDGDVHEPGAEQAGEGR